MNTKLTRTAILCSCGLLAGAAWPISVLGQSQDSAQPSVAEAARRAREKKEAAGQKPAVKVVTNDDLKPAAPAPPPADVTTPSGDNAAAQQNPAQPENAAAPEDKEAKAAKAAELARLKAQLKDAQSDLDLLQRELALERDTYYASPDYAHNTEGKAKLDGLQLQITDKQQAVEELKTKLAALGELIAPPTAPQRTPPPTAPQPPAEPSPQAPQ